MKKPNKKSDPLIVNKLTIAHVLGASLNSVGNWDREGLPSVKQGKQRLYHVASCVQWLLERELKKLSSLSQESAKFTQIKRRRQELLLKKEQGLLMLKADAHAFFTMIGVHLKTTLESWPHRLAGRLSGMNETRPIIALLKGEVRGLLLSLRDMEIK